MRAHVGDVVIAEADDSELVSIEGNWYFPPSAVRPGALSETDTPYTCPWKGECQYYAISVGDRVLADRAWSYPHPYPGAVERVGRDFAGYVAFWKEIEVSS